MKYTPKGIIQSSAPNDTDYPSAIQVANWAANKINELEQLLVQKDQQLRNARIRALRNEQKAMNLKQELINMSELI